jgi:hypothetical protein
MNPRPGMSVFTPGNPKILGCWKLRRPLKATDCWRIPLDWTKGPNLRLIAAHIAAPLEGVLKGEPRGPTPIGTYYQVDGWLSITTTNDEVNEPE